MTETHSTEAPSLAADIVSGQRAGTTLITKHFTFEAAHYLPNVPDGHKCRRMHGHSYQVWVHVRGDVDQRHGWIVDFGDIKTAWKSLDRELDHHLLNELPGLENPTAENLAAWIWARLRDANRDFFIAAVEVAETVDSKAMFVAPGTTSWVPGHPQMLLSDAPVRTQAAAAAVVARSGSEMYRADGVSSPRPMEDVQSRPDTRGIALDEVGVSRVRVPMEVLDRQHGKQGTVAQVTMAVDLAAGVKGTHLSRFIQAMRDHQDALTLFSLSELTADLRRRLTGDRIRVRAEFPYFIPKAAPVSGEVGNLDVDCAFELIDEDGVLQHWLEVTAPITTVCPCSRDISDYGAHNQRGRVTMRVRCANDEAELPALVWIEELVEVAEGAASSPVYPVVKRPDERHITMAAYDKPQFVEDVTRDVAAALAVDSRVAAYEILVENDESIHAHNAFARASG